MIILSLLFFAATFTAAAATLEAQTCMQQLKGYSYSCKLNFQANGPCWAKIERGECERICGVPASTQCSPNQQTFPAQVKHSDMCKSCINYLADAFGEANTRDCVIFKGENKCWSRDYCRTTCGEACGVDKICGEEIAPATPAPTPTERDALPVTDAPSSDGVQPNGSPCAEANECLDACVFEAGSGKCQDSSSFDSLQISCTPGVTDCTCVVTSTSSFCAVAKEDSNAIDPATIGIIAGVSAAFLLLIGLAAVVLVKRNRKTPVAKVISKARDGEGKGVDVDVDIEKDSKVTSTSKGRSGGHVLNPQSSVTVL